MKSRYIEMERFHRLAVTFGIWYPAPTSAHNRVILFFQIMRSIACIILWFPVLIAAIMEGFLKSMEGTAFFAVIGFVTNLFIVVFYCQRSDTERITDLFESALHDLKNGWEKEFIRTRTDSVWKYIKLLNNFFVVYTFILFGVIPALNRILQCYGFRGVTVLPLPMRGLTDDIPKAWYWNYALDFLGCAWGWLALFSFMAVIYTYFVLTAYISIYIDLLCEKIKLLGEGDEEHYDISSVNRDSTLREIIKDHQTVLRLSKGLIESYGFVAAVMNRVFSVSTCLSLITATHEFSRNPMVAVGGSIVCIVCINTLLAICFAGNYLKDKCELISDSMFNLPWYRLSPKTRKTLNLMLMCAVKPIVINYRGIVPITLNRFMQAMNSAYSYFTLLRSVIPD